MKKGSVCKNQEIRTARKVKQLHQFIDFFVS